MLSPAQRTVATAQERWRVLIAGRRFGKTHLAIRELCRFASECDRLCWYVAPSYRMARQIVWRPLRQRLEALRWIGRSHETEMSIDLVNGSRIQLKGSDNEDSLRGVGLDFAVLDEFADIASTAWYEVLRPTLSDRQGSALFIGTPKGMGNWSYDIYSHAARAADWSRFQYTTLDGGNVPAEEIESARQDLDERTFRQEYLATFESHSGKIYYNFDSEHNTVDTPEITATELHIGMDFNIDPMTAVVAVRAGEVLTVVDEIRIFGSNTDEMADEIQSRYPGRRIAIYPDPAGHQRKTSAGGATDITLLRNRGFRVVAARSHTQVRDRINAVNARLCTAAGLRRLFVSRTAKYCITALERQTYKPGTTQPDKDRGFDHTNDALGYMVDAIFPVRTDTAVTPPERWGHRIA